MLFSLSYKESKAEEKPTCQRWRWLTVSYIVCWINSNFPSYTSTSKLISQQNQQESLRSYWQSWDFEDIYFKEKKSRVVRWEHQYAIHILRKITCSNCQILLFTQWINFCGIAFVCQEYYFRSEWKWRGEDKFLSEYPENLFEWSVLFVGKSVSTCFSAETEWAALFFWKKSVFQFSNIFSSSYGRC